MYTNTSSDFRSVFFPGAVAEPDELDEPEVRLSVRDFKLLIKAATADKTAMKSEQTISEWHVN